MVKPRKSLVRDFEVFARGVEELEKLKAELNSLDTTGYEKEADSIRVKLNNVSYIPEIEKEMRNLKTKIWGESRKYRKKKRGSKETKRKFISDEYARIYRRLKELDENRKLKDSIEKIKLKRKLRELEDKKRKEKEKEKELEEIRKLKELEEEIKLKDKLIELEEKKDRGRQRKKDGKK